MHGGETEIQLRIARFFNILSPLRSKEATEHHPRGGVLASAGRWREAMVEYEAALKLDPFFADCHYNLGASSRNDNCSGSGCRRVGVSVASRGKQGEAKSSEGTRADSLSHAIALATVRSRVLSSALRRCRDVDPPARRCPCSTPVTS